MRKRHVADAGKRPGAAPSKFSLLGSIRKATVVPRREWNWGDRGRGCYGGYQAWREKKRN